MSKNPFPGPQPYRASDRALFYGRDDLAYKLEGSLLANRCVTVYGPSGAGKSSLVQASVIPTLIESQEIRVVRVDGWPEDREPTAWLAAAAYSNLSFGDMPSDISAADALIAAAQRAARRSPRIMLIYLDQIEQLLYASRNAAESEAFFDNVNRLVETPLRNLRVVLSLREDYLGRFRDRLRDHRRILDHGFRVGPLTVAELTSAVCQAAAAGDPPQEWDPDAMRELMIQVRVPGQAASDDAEAQAAYAQIVCRALFQERAQEGAQGGAAAKSGEAATEAEPILRRYLDTTLEDLGPLRASAQRLLEDHLVGVDGSRALRTEKEFLRFVPEAELGPILAALEAAAILHAEQRQGSRYFELGHDWLARKVFEQRQERERIEEERKRDEEIQRKLKQERAANEAKLAEAKRRVSIFIGVAFISIAMTVGAVTLFVFARNQKLTAERATQREVRARQVADEKKKAADAARILSTFRELSGRGKLAWAMKLLPEVDNPETRRGWVELASDALNNNALRASLSGHKGPLSAAVWSPGGTLVLTASADKTVRIFHADGRGDPKIFRGHEGPVMSAAWSSDDKHVLTASEDGTARLWLVDGSGEPIVFKGHKGAVVLAAFSPDEKRVLTAGVDGTARIWKADGTGNPIVLSGHTGQVNAAIWSKNGARVFTAGADGTVCIWASDRSGKPLSVLKDHTAEVLSIALSPDGEQIVTASRDKTARIWPADGKGKPIVLKGHEGSIYQARFSADGLRVVTASADRTARVWQVDGKGEPIILRGHDLSVTSASFSPDGKYVATASSDKTARIWPADGSGVPLVLTGHEAPLRQVSWSPDGKSVLTAASDRSGTSVDHTAKVWSIEPMRSLPHEEKGGGSYHSASIGEDGEIFAAAYDDTTARLLRVDGTGDPIVFKGHEGWVASANLSPDGSKIATASFDKTARIWSADGKGEPILLKGHEGPVRAAVWSPDGKRVLTISDDKIARLFAADGSGQPVVMRGHEDWLASAAFSLDGSKIVTTSLDQTARIWKTGTEAPVAVITEHKATVNAAAFSPDGSKIVTASDDRTARIFSAEGGASLKVLRGHTGPILRVIWSPDGRRIATSSADGTLRIWTVEGSVPPIVLDVSAPVIGMKFINKGEKLFTISSDHTRHWWMIDVKTLSERLLTAHADCVPPATRRLALAESTRVAEEKYAECERSFNRTPELPEKKAQ